MTYTVIIPDYNTPKSEEEKEAEQERIDRRIDADYDFYNDEER